MSIKEITKILMNSGIEENEAKIEAKMLVVADENLALERALLRAKTRRPIQYILGSAYFMGEDFIVNEDVLIPRDETELLVRKAIEIIKAENFRQVLDIGCGSGCISCIVAKNTAAQVLGVDISTSAIQVALDNTSKLGLFNRALYRKSDIYSKIRSDEKFDLIISNPPYIPKKDIKNLQTEVGFEPEIALFAEDDGLEFYKRIVKDAPKHLNNGGYLMFEAGINQAHEIKKLMMSVGFSDIEIIKDLAQIERVIFGHS